MKVALGSDTPTELSEAIANELQARGHQVIAAGPVVRSDAPEDWPLVAERVGRLVADGEADEGIVCCWTGTGVSIAANKISGVRAALVGDSETARGARIYNHANVLALSLRATTIPIMKEILDSWFSTSTAEGQAVSPWNLEQVRRVELLEHS